MPNPAFVFGFVVSTLYGAVFHLLMGGDARRLALFLLAGWLGFVLGHVIGDIFAINIFDIGDIHFAAATAGAFIALVGTHVMSLDRNRSGQPSR